MGSKFRNFWDLAHDSLVDCGHDRRYHHRCAGRPADGDLPFGDGKPDLGKNCAPGSRAFGGHPFCNLWLLRYVGDCAGNPYVPALPGAYNGRQPVGGHYHFGDYGPPNHRQCFGDRFARGSGFLPGGVLGFGCYADHDDL